MEFASYITLFASYITLIDVIWLGGLIIFGAWLLKTSLGRKALVDSVPRRNNMPLYIPLLFLTVWLTLAVLGQKIAAWLSNSAGLADWQGAVLSYSSIGVLQILLIFVMVFIGWFFFAGRLKGFGFDARTVGKDLGAAVMNLAAILPVVLALTWLVNYFGILIKGDDFQMQQNEALTTIITHARLFLRAIVFVFAACIAPAFEEIMFRGLFQSMLRGVVKNAWTAIILTSALFALLHPWTHWPALFALSMCLGYSYEKSGSLFRPIFIHALFNGITIIAVLYSV